MSEKIGQLNLSMINKTLPASLQGGFVLRTEDFVTTVLYKTKKTVKETGKKMPERIMEIIKENPQITVSDIAEQCGLTYNGAYYHIEKMRKKGILSHKGGEWAIL